MHQKHAFFLINLASSTWVSCGKIIEKLLHCNYWDFYTIKPCLRMMNAMQNIYEKALTLSFRNFCDVVNQDVTESIFCHVGQNLSTYMDWTWNNSNKRSLSNRFGIGYMIVLWGKNFNNYLHCNYWDLYTIKLFVRRWQTLCKILKRKHLQKC